MFTVALTGGIGSGKSAATHVFAQLGVQVVDLDAISHQLTEKSMPLLANIRAAFGDAVFDADGSLNRAKLRTQAFRTEATREKLNAILHPAIFAKAIQQLQSSQQAPYQILSIPLLDENSHYFRYFDRVLVIDAEEEIQIARVKKRSGLSEDEIRRIIAAQTPRQARLSMADDVLKNNGNLQELALKIKVLHEKYLKRCIVSKTT